MKRTIQSSEEITRLIHTPSGGTTGLGRFICLQKWKQLIEVKFQSWYHDLMALVSPVWDFQTVSGDKKLPFNVENFLQNDKINGATVVTFVIDLFLKNIYII